MNHHQSSPIITYHQSASLHESSSISINHQSSVIIIQQSSIINYHTASVDRAVGPWMKWYLRVDPKQGLGQLPPV
jgi:hypothetical protein